ncbi:DHA2 family efflux MFS transporter permease subunit [Parasporobacterium paucivorans]|uniref:MFS transporter, DHA2 family, lincomycin resistance protein n=1 Tax=Parasporobacterium paucivorans DSM 15970 TaxID=1122934 RepID=A0A1M6K4X9_9FIRM|nr:DHA2 family efflux MFS transporter permease subunit [Parasporobacterium paucivorans]SHJ53967.1 MFS transporter, DHA2 family, lincomycin resistance protein [Parasporobacterium paucivorans DSM 15970]
MKTVTKKINTSAIIAVLVFSGLIATLTETILNVALSPLMEEMRVTPGTIQWIITAYMIVVAIFVPITAFLMQTFRTKQLFLSAMTILLVGNIAAVFSGTFELLLISRILQAAGTGIIIPLMMTTVLTVAPPEKRGAVMGLCGAALTLGPALGPTIAGIVLQSYSWHVLFVILIVLIVLSMISGAAFLVNVSNVTKPKMDILSIVLSTIGFGGFIYGISSISGTGDMKVIATIFIIGLLCLILFCRRQLSLKEPMLNIRVFKYPVFTIGTVLVMLSMMAIFTMAVMLPMFLQGALGANPFVAAMTLLPATLISAAATPFAGKALDRFGPKVLLPVGFAVILVPLFILSRANVDTSIMTIIILFIIVDIGIALTMSPSQTTALTPLPKKEYPHGVAILNTLQQLSAAIGAALFIGIMSASQLKALTAQAPAPVANAAGFSDAVLVLSGFVLAGIVLSLCLAFFLKKRSLSKDTLTVDAEIFEK